MPKTPVQRLVRPFVRYLQVESASGIVLLICTAAALVIANSNWADAYAEFWHIHLRIAIGSWELDESLAHWVNDGLMAIFFFVVGLEIKREIVDGELREPKKAALPIMAALGGMIAPALIYLSFQYGKEGHSGWGIPMATDIAFVVGFLALLGRRVPLGLKILLLALAIADDIGAVLVIALFYSSKIAVVPLGVAALGFALAYFCNRAGVRRQRVCDYRRGDLAGIFLLWRTPDSGGCHAWTHDSGKCLAWPLDLDRSHFRGDRSSRRRDRSSTWSRAARNWRENWQRRHKRRSHRWSVWRRHFIRGWPL